MRPRARLAGGVLGAALLLGALAPSPALAHGLAVRADLPIPEWLFAWGAALVLIVSFVALAVLWPRPRLDPEQFRALPTTLGRTVTSRPVEIVTGAIGVFMLAIVVWSGLLGVQTPDANFAPTFVFVAFWVGLVPISLVFGDIFRAFNPWRAIGRTFGWAFKRIGGREPPEPLPYPERLGRWPAAIGLFAFVWLELVAADGNAPSSIAIATLVYSAATFLGMALYGVNAWIDRAEAFSVYFNLISRISPFERRDHEIGIRRALSGLAAMPALPGTVALLMVLIGSITFDGLHAGELWNSIVPELQDLFASLGASPGLALELGFGLGLIAAIALVAGFYRLGVLGVQTVSRQGSARKVGHAFVHSLVPIAVVYALAHYTTFLLTQGQDVAFLASDPLGEGWDLFGTAASSIDYGIIGTSFTWYLQVGFVVAGHVAALVSAHDRALVRYSDGRVAVRSQYWMLAVMIGFTILALWLLAQANQG